MSRSSISPRIIVICRYCFHNMASRKVTSCTANQIVIFPDGLTLAAIAYDKDERCGDCNVKRGGYHHPGGDRERCPRCGGQLISCGCLQMG